MKVSLAKVFASLSEDEAQAAYNALAQWADNKRCGVEEVDASDDDLGQLTLVEKLVANLEAELVKIAEAPAGATFDMDGTEHRVGDPTCCRSQVCPDCGGREHYQPVFGGYYYECEKCHK